MNKSIKDLQHGDKFNLKNTLFEILSVDNPLHQVWLLLTLNHRTKEQELMLGDDDSILEVIND